MQRYAALTKVQGLGCDTGMQPEDMADLARAQGVVVQGNLDPLLLVAGGAGDGAAGRGHSERAEGRAASSSTWGTGSCPRRRRRMWRGWWSWCGEA